jgi:hypothetical protein
MDKQKKYFEQFMKDLWEKISLLIVDILRLIISKPPEEKMKRCDHCEHSERGTVNVLAKALQHDGQTKNRAKILNS